MEAVSESVGFVANQDHNSKVRMFILPK